MDYVEIIQQSLDYIEQHLTAAITVGELASDANFSVYHYHRLFTEAVGMPVGRYITRRRLLWAIYEACCGKKIVDAALRYGFDTAAGFSKAFRKEFGISPSQYIRRYPAHRPRRIQLGTEEHIMLSKEKLKWVLTHWNMQDETICSITYEASGEVNENVFAVGADHLLKVFANLGGINRNLAVYDVLREAGMPSVSSVPLADGCQYLVDEGLYFLLTKRVKGERLPARSLFDPKQAEFCRSVGASIGRLHLALSRYIGVYCREKNIFQEVKEEWLTPARKAMGLSDAFCADYLAAVEKLDGKLPEQIIHRDPNPDNILFEDGKLSAFLDFDLSQKSIRIFDPCYAATAILVENFDRVSEQERENWVGIFQQIIGGYDETVHLTEAEKEALPYVVLSIQLICVGYFSSDERYAELAAANIRMTEWLIERMEKLGWNCVERLR